MFYAASALLEAHGLRTRKHSGLHALFGEHFAKTGRIDPKFHRWLLEAFVMRLEGDYSFESGITAEDTATVIAQAREFLREAEILLSA